MSKPLPPFLTPFEFIRVFTNALNLTKQSKYLDDRVHNLTADYRDIKTAIEQFVQEPLEHYLDKERATIIGATFASVFAEYLSQLRSIDLDGITRNDNEALLAEYFLPSVLVRCINFIANKMPGPDIISLLGQETSAVATVLNWAETNLIGWSQFLEGLSGDKHKDKRDRINSWKRGVDLPTVTYIKGLQQWSQGPWPEFLDWNHLKAWLLLARAVDWSKKSPNGCKVIEEVRTLLWGAVPSKSYLEAANEAQRIASKKLTSIFPIAAKLQNVLMRTASKAGHDSSVLKSELEHLRSELSKIDSESTTAYWVDWHEARWHVFSGDLKSANKCYKTAFDGCLFRSGENQKIIMEEARSVAASLKTPDKNFLKKIRNTSVLFGIEPPISTVPSFPQSNKSSDFFEDWEIDLWKADFKQLFPREGKFESCDETNPSERIGPLIFSDIKRIKPDFRYPNREFKIGDTWKKKIPQIVWFSMQENTEVVQKLLKNGATLDCESDAGDTPIQIALECLNAFDIPLKSLDRTLWDMFSAREDASIKINNRTHKRKLLPLVLAVKSGLPDVVARVLQLGADVNGRGETDEQTALNVCIKLIGAVKSPDAFWKKQLEVGLTPAVMESIRRHSNGLVRDLHAKEHYAQFSESDFYQNIKNETFSTLRTRMLQHYRLDNLYEITDLLFAAGADVNAEHTSPLNGYTPLMLAAEINEGRLFNQMLMHRGKPDKAYYVEGDRRFADCWDIAFHFNSFSVIKVLNDIRVHFNRPAIPVEVL